jgi:DNA sulfur modification protein DndC
MACPNAAGYNPHMNAANDLMQDDIHLLWCEVVEGVKKEYLSEEQAYPWILGFSGGKDSTVVAHALFEALLSLPPSKRTRAVHVVSNDTLVESPLVVAHLERSQASIREAAKNWGLPITVATTKPQVDKTFWALLIGKGYRHLRRQ